MSVIFFWIIILSPIQNYGQVQAEDPVIQLQHTSYTIKDYLQIIKDQTGFVFSYSPNLTDVHKIIKVNRQQIRMSELLKILFKDQFIEPIRKGENKIVLAPYQPVEREEPVIVEVYRIAGVVKDMESGEFLVGAYVSDASAEFVAMTNDIGRFQIIVPTNVKSLFVSYVGFEPHLIRIYPAGPHNQEIELRRNSEIDEVIISDVSGEQHLADKSQNHFFRNGTISSDLLIIGHEDPYNALTHLSSVQSGNEAQNGLMVRGGSQDQNLILVDGVPLYESSHILGFSSVLNSDAIKNIQMFKQAFPAKYGGKLSSVIDYQLKEGNNHFHEFSAGINTFNTHIHSNGPVIKDQTTYSISARKSNLNLLFGNMINRFLEYEETDFRYYDISAKVYHNINDQNSLSLSVLKAHDRVNLRSEELITDELKELKIKNKDHYDWGSSLVSLKWTSILSQNLSAKFYAYLTNYRYETRSSFQFDVNDYNVYHQTEFDVMAQSHIRNRGIKSEFSLFKSNQFKIEFGSSVVWHHFNPMIRQSEIISYDEYDINDFPENAVRASEVSGYTEAQYGFGASHSITFGGRINSMNVHGKKYLSAEPRISLDLKLSSNSQLGISYTGMAQFTHLLVNSGIGLPSELYVPSTEDLPPETARQVSISYFRQLPEDVNLNVSAYYKKMDNVLEYSRPYDLFHTFINDDNAENLFSDPRTWQEHVSTGESTIKGVEVALGKKSGPYLWNVTYSLSKADRQFKDLNDGEPFPYRFDRRHDLRLQSKILLNRKFSIGGQWVYGTGHAFSLAIEQYQTYNGDLILHSDGVNNFRFKPYHRLDLFVDYEHIYSSGHTLRINTGVRNVYNRKNSYYVYLFENPINEKFELRQVSILPILPQLNAYYTF